MNRRLTIGVIPALAMIAIVLPMVLWWGEFPDSIATHWDLGGAPNGHMPPTVLLIGVVVLFLAVWGAVWRANRDRATDLPSYGAGLAGIGGLLAAIVWLTADSNRGITEWTDAGEIGGLQLLAVLAATIIAGFVGWIAGGGRGRSATSTPVDGPGTIELEPGESLAWSGKGRGVVLVVVGIAIMVAAIVVWSSVSLFLAGIGLIILVFAEVRATAGRRGVTVSLGWLGLPSWLVSIDRIERAEMEHVAPMAYGGWGYRLRPGVRALVVKGGPALRLVRKDMPDLVLTVDDAERGAAVVNTLVERARSR